MKFLLAVGISLGCVLVQARPGVRSVPSFGPRGERASTFMPTNKLHLQPSLRVNNGMTEQMFNQIIDQVVNQYKPVVARYGATLVANKLWTDETVNAKAYQNGNTWTVEMYGGLARRPEITPDAFTLVVCHELGHHLGGYVFKGNDWAAAEGQSDYFATQVCARTLWGQQSPTNMAWRRGLRMADTMRSACDAAWSNEAARGWCYRVNGAGLGLATLLSKLEKGKQPAFETPDPSVVATTDVDHPAAQCRLDTMFQGSLCSKSFDLRMIPGKMSTGVGFNNLAAELTSAKVTCFKEDGLQVGYRPTCWFRSLRPQGQFR